MRQNERQKIYILGRYVAPRKRKPIDWSYTGVDLGDCLDHAREFLKLHGGKFTSAFYTKCTCYDVPMGDGTDRVITMQDILFSSICTDIPLSLLVI